MAIRFGAGRPAVILNVVLTPDDRVAPAGRGSHAAAAARAPDDTLTGSVTESGLSRTLSLRWFGQTRRAAWAAGITLAAALLFLAYLRQSQRVPVGSDAGSIALQAWDMRHGNLLLHGWAMSDVSFWSTELMQYVLLEALHGLGPDVIHIGGAMTYTLLVLLTACAARGRAAGRRGAVRALLAAVIMLAPAPGASPTLLLTPDHLGSAVPVLLAWLAAERLPARRARRAGWYAPVAVALLLAWGQVGDGLILVTGVAPMAVACGARAWGTARRRAAPTGPDPGVGPDPGARPGAAASPWPDVCLVIAAIASAGLARAAVALIRAGGGFVLKPVATQFAGLPAMPQHLELTAGGLLAIFGARAAGPPSLAGLAVTALHLIGLAAVAVATAAALRRLPRGGEPAVPGLALAIVFNVAAYLPTPYVQNLLSTREISAVLPFGAVLAGRVLAAPLLRARLTAAPAAAGLVFAVALGCHAAGPAVPAQNQSLASWLAARHLTAGLSADYWVANSTTLDAGARITVRQVSLSNGALVRPLSWGFKPDWYDPVTCYADFLVARGRGPQGWGAAAARAFGPPARALHPGGYTVLVWHKNLLADIR